jgi:hypothetical protein
MERKQELRRGQALLLMVVIMSLVFVAMLGLAIDMSRMYAQRQMAQAAADAAAQAAASSIKGGTNTGANAFGTATLTCAAGSAITPCVYATLNGFSAANGDIVKVDFPTSVAGISLTSSYVPPAARVTLIRPAPTTLMKMVGISSLNVAAQSTAVITGGKGIPLIVTGGSLNDAVKVDGGATLEVCGGGSPAIVINSCAGSAACGGTQAWVLSGSGKIDLSKAGPLDDGACTTGTGGSLTSVGTSSVGGGASVLTGTAGSVSTGVPTAAAANPYATVPVPTTAGRTTNPSVCTVNTVLNGLPNSCQQGVGYAALGCAVGSTCRLYFPGVYTSGITIGGVTKAVMAPGLYYLSSGGLAVGNSGSLSSAGGLADDPVTGQGQLFFLTGNSVLSVSGAAAVSITGASTNSIYLGLAIMEDPSATGIHAHTVGASGGLDVRGALLLAQSPATSSSYSSLTISGASGVTTAAGQVIADKIYVTGSGRISLRLPYGASTGGNSGATVVLGN